jgi:hypothetical protein
VKPADVRTELVRTLRLDAIGPDPGDPERSESLSQAPSEWYLTGFLVPYQAKAEERQDPTSNEDVDQGGDAGGTDDDKEHEKPSARRAFVPSSIGLSVLVPAGVKALQGTMTWGDYRYVEPEKSEAASPPRAVLRPAFPLDRTGAQSLPARQVHRRRRLKGLRHLGELHRGGPGAEHRDGPAGR